MIDLDKGILFEDNGKLIKWGLPLDFIYFNNNYKLDNRGDRKIYRWGKHKILDGLELELTSMFWKEFNFKFLNRFNHVEAWFVGDLISFSEFERISKHLEIKFGKPSFTKYDEKNKEKEITYLINDVKLTLFLFEQHCYKLVFRISKI
jgi:hypothetical protein